MKHGTQLICNQYQRRIRKTIRAHSGRQTAGDRERLKIDHGHPLHIRVGDIRALCARRQDDHVTHIRARVDRMFDFAAVDIHNEQFALGLGHHDNAFAVRQVHDPLRLVVLHQVVGWRLST